MIIKLPQLFDARLKNVIQMLATETCAIEAEAIGTGSMYSYTLSNGRCNSSSNIDSISLYGTGGARSKQFWNSSTYSGGKKVGADAMNCTMTQSVDYPG
jgi:glutamine cyclotransferase